MKTRTLCYFVMMALAAVVAFAGCNDPGQAGGGIVGTVSSSASPTMGAGWEVGSGQCNGDFTYFEDSGFPSSGGHGIQLAMRAERRSVGAVSPAPAGSGDYEVAVGSDPTNSNRAWWNFQQSIAYDGDLSDLDAVCFAIETVSGNSIPADPVNMLDVRGIIDDRNGQPNPTATFADIYQTSQNPVFSWFDQYEMSEPGAWRLYLTASSDKHVAEVSICIHTPGESCPPESQSGRGNPRRRMLQRAEACQ